MKDIHTIKELGFQVYFRNPEDTYCYFSDGKAFGYIQEKRGGGFHLTTVHIPNHSTGTGYGFGDIHTITREPLQHCLNTFAPAWASHRDLSSVKKYETLNQFLKAHSWGGGLKELQ